LINFEELVQKGESATLEFKKSTALLPKIGETLCGFLNGRGGRVFIGVSDEGKLIGQTVSDNTLREISELFKKFEPPPLIEIERIELHKNNGVIVLTAIHRGSDAPYVFAGRPYQRVGSTTSIMPQQAYQRLLIERDHHRHRWETEIAEGYTHQDLNTEEILRTLKMGVAAGRIPDSQGEDIPSILDKLGLRKGNQLLNAAVVLFGKKFLPNFAQCQLRLARFRGVDKSDVALREALVNALCHRLYTYPGGAVSVAIFDDRLEIWNDGKLPFGLTPADLKVDHASHQRNPLIATIFYNRGLIERWGRGTQKILSLCVKAGHPEPDFFEQSNSFVIRFLPSGYIAPHRISHDLTNRQREILQAVSLGLKQGVTLTDVRLKLSFPPADRTLRDDFQHLKRLGLVDLTGHGRGARWVLANKAE
jgi:ATP-dependent DNA helicase RecG